MKKIEKKKYNIKTQAEFREFILDKVSQMV